eukprot:scaffold679651_cov46-Prasinocladus_malaysianus.AAC.1
MPLAAESGRKVVLTLHNGDLSGMTRVWPRQQLLVERPWGSYLRNYLQLLADAVLQRKPGRPTYNKNKM